jgi:cytochrome c-type biogenesis protein
MRQTLRISPASALPKIIPFLFGGLVLGVAVAAGFATDESTTTGGVNGFVERLSGSSGNLLGGIGAATALGFAFGAGMVATVNPCGFAMLPAYLGLYLGEREEVSGTLTDRLRRAVWVGAIMTAGLVLLFGIAGIAISAGARSILQYVPWIGLGIGAILAVVGSYLLAGGNLYSGLAVRTAGRMGNPGRTGARGYFIFGLTYGTASLSCTMPIFLAVVGSTLAVSGVVAATGQFILYALGMGFVIMMLTLGIGVFKGAMVGNLRRIMPYTHPISAVLMIVAGSYIVFYWLTLGGLA